ncbi:MAG: MFS transporter [Halanaerobiaceae bacterium]
MSEKLTMNKSKSDSKANLKINFSILMFFFWSSWAVYGAYVVYYFTDIGLTNMEIGTIMSLRTFMGIIGPPVVAYLCDKFKTRKNIFIISLIILGVMVMPFPLYNKILIIIFSALIEFFWSPQQSILDSWILETSTELSENYGFMRAWGSIGFAIFVSFSGNIIEKWGWNVHFISYGIFILIAVLVASFIKDESYSNISFHQDNDRDTRHPINLLKNKKYVLLLTITIFIFIPIQIIFIYLAPIIRSVGGTARHLGYTLFFNALSEAPIFFVGKFILNKFKIKTLLLISATFYLIRIIIAASVTNPIFFIFFGIFQSLSFGIYLISVRNYVNKIAPETLKTTAQSIVLMVAFGLGGIISSLLGGYLIDTFGMNIMFTFCIIMSSFAIILLLIFSFLDKFKIFKNQY